MTTAQDGSTTTTTTAKDGSATTTEKAADGSTGTVKTDAQGNTVSAEVVPSSKAIEDAAKSGEAVTLPVEIKAATNAESAAEVRVTLPASVSAETPAKVEIPVENLTPGTVAVIVHADGVVLTLEESATVKIVDNTKYFSDVHAGDWFADAVTWLVENGIASGMGGDFGANEDVTREQLAVMLYNYANFKGCDTTMSGSIAGFPDAGSVDGYARSALAWAVGVGLINGTTDSSGNIVLDPQGSATRAQIAAIVERFCENVAR